MKDFLLVSSACVFVLSCTPVSMAASIFDVFLLPFLSLFLFFVFVSHSDPRLHGCLKSQDSEAVFRVPLLFSLLIHDGLAYLLLTFSPLFLLLLPFSLRLFSPSLYNPFVMFLGALFLYL